MAFDENPFFAEAEAIVVRKVTRYWEAIENLGKVGLYAKKLDSNALKSYIIDTLKSRLNLRLEDWPTTHQD